MNAILAILIIIACYANFIIYDIYHDDATNMIERIVEHPITSAWSIGITGGLYALGSLFVADMCSPVTSIIVLTFLCFSSYYMIMQGHVLN
jgi:hypothetical protein